MFRTEEKNIKTYGCYLCDKNFNKKSTLNDHISIHKNERKHK